MYICIYANNNFRHVASTRMKEKKKNAVLLHIEIKKPAHRFIFR